MHVEHSMVEHPSIDYAFIKNHALLGPGLAAWLTTHLYDQCHFKPPKVSAGRVLSYATCDRHHNCPWHRRYELVYQPDGTRVVTEYGYGDHGTVVSDKHNRMRQKQLADQLADSSSRVSALISHLVHNKHIKRAELPNARHSSLNGRMSWSRPLVQ